MELLILITISGIHGISRIYHRSFTARYTDSRRHYRRKKCLLTFTAQFWCPLAAGSFDFLKCFFQPETETDLGEVLAAALPLLQGLSEVSWSRPEMRVQFSFNKTLMRNNIFIEWVKLQSVRRLPLSFFHSLTIPQSFSILDTASFLILH